MSEVIQPQVNCSTAREFLDAISPSGPYFESNRFDETWLYRGQGRDIPLIPTLFRQDDKLANFTSRNLQQYSQRLLAERDVLIQFFESADRRGLALPDDSQKLRSILEILNSESGEVNLTAQNPDWIFRDETLSLAALAQHYGLPTRLLDWTRLPLIAAYFAAEGPYLHPNTDPSNLMVVWAFYFPLFGKHDTVASTYPIRIVTAPSASNPNLKAQQGVFSLISPLGSNEANGAYKPLEQLLEELTVRANTGPSANNSVTAGCRLRKFTLPASKSTELLYLLARLDITPSTVYPGFRCIVDDMQMRKKFQDARY